MNAYHIHFTQSFTDYRIFCGSWGLRERTRELEVKQRCYRVAEVDIQGPELQTNNIILGSLLGLFQNIKMSWCQDVWWESEKPGFLTENQGFESRRRVTQPEDSRTLGFYKLWKKISQTRDRFSEFMEIVWSSQSWVFELKLNFIVAEH